MFAPLQCALEYSRFDKCVNLWHSCVSTISIQNPKIVFVITSKFCVLKDVIVLFFKLKTLVLIT